MSLLILLFFKQGTSFRFVATNDAAACCSQKPMVSGIVAGDTADYCALKAAFCVSRRNNCQSKDSRRTSDKRFHSDLQTFSFDEIRVADYPSRTR
jgi:hypothetical protein